MYTYHNLDTIIGFSCCNGCMNLEGIEKAYGFPSIQKQSKTHAKAKDPHFVPAGMHPRYPNNHADIGPNGT